MRIFLISVFLVFSFSYPLLAKDDANLIASTDQLLAQYHEGFAKQSIPSILNTIHPDLFIVLTRDRQENRLKQMFANPHGSKIRGVDVVSQLEEKSFSSGKFVIVKVNLHIEVPRPGDSHPDLDVQLMDMLHRQMKGQGKVVLDEKAYLFKITKPSWLMAIWQKPTGWKLLEGSQIEVITKRAKLLPSDFFTTVKNEIMNLK